MTNLPKKKNVHRDLKVAFKEVSGVLNIAPAVTGNKKTKDPVCKGFALVDFKSEVDANRYENVDTELAFYGSLVIQGNESLVFFLFFLRLLGLWRSSVDRDCHLGKL